MTYFDGNLPLLPDQSFLVTDVNTPIPESLPDCVTNP